MTPSLRKEVWPFLLGLYDFDSSKRERTRICSKRHEEYRAIDQRRLEKLCFDFDVLIHI